MKRVCVVVETRRENDRKKAQFHYSLWWVVGWMGGMEKWGRGRKKRRAKTKSRSTTTNGRPVAVEATLELTGKLSLQSIECIISDRFSPAEPDDGASASRELTRGRGLDGAERDGLHTDTRYHRDE